MKPECDGSEFCCKVGGKVCEYSVQHQAGRKYACGLYLKYGSWPAVVQSPEYEPIGKHWARNDPDRFNYCETFNPLFCCREELKPEGVRNEADLIAYLDSPVHR